MAQPPDAKPGARPDPWVGLVVASPGFFPFLTFREQIEAAVRRWGAWDADAQRAVETLLFELSVPEPGGMAELIRQAHRLPPPPRKPAANRIWSLVGPPMCRLLRVRAPVDVAPDVSWRFALAQAAALAPRPPEDGPDSGIELHVEPGPALTNRPGWPSSGPARSQVDRFLAGWSRRVGLVLIHPNNLDFARDVDRRAEALPEHAPSWVIPIAGAPWIRAVAALSWAAWMTRKEAAWRPLWLAGWSASLPLLIGSVAQAIADEFQGRRDLLTFYLLAILSFMVLDLFSRAYVISTSSLLKCCSPRGPWSDPSVLRPWLVGRTLCAAVQAAFSMMLAVIATHFLLGKLRNHPGEPLGDWAFLWDHARYYFGLCALVFAALFSRMRPLLAGRGL